MSNEEYAMAYQAGNRAVLLDLWTQVEKLAVKLVRPYLGLAHRNRAVDYEDLMQSAFLAVERTASVYREGEGAFTTVMGFYIKSECSALLGLNGRKRTEHYESVSASTPLGEDTTATIIDTIADDSLPGSDDNLLRDDVQREVQAALDRLPDDQAQVARGYYLEGKSCPALAAQMGMEAAQVYRIRQKGYLHLHRDRRLQELADWDDTAWFRHIGARSFNQTWTSSTEAAVLRLLGEG